MSYDRLRDLKLESRGILGLAVGIISVRHRLTVYLGLSVGAAKKDGTDGGVSNWRDSENAEGRGSKTSWQGSACPVQSRFSSSFCLLLHIPHSTSTLLHCSTLPLASSLFLDFLASRLIVFDFVVMTPPHPLLPWLFTAPG